MQRVNGGIVICSGFPSIVDEEERLNYKREFDQDHQEYKSLQAELDNINQLLAELDRDMDTHPEGSPQFLVSSSPTCWQAPLWPHIPHFTIFKDNFDSLLTHFVQDKSNEG